MARLSLPSDKWGLVTTRQFFARPQKDKYLPINSYIDTVESRICVVYLSSKSAQTKWWLGGEVISYSHVNSKSKIAIASTKLPLNQATLINNSASITARPYGIEIKFAPWHKDIYLEIWQSKLEYQESPDTKKILEEIAILDKKIQDISEFGRS
jgi:hypothetical protein